MRSKERCSAFGSAGGLSVIGNEKCARIPRNSGTTSGIKTFLNGPLTSNIVIDASQVASDTRHYGRPKKASPWVGCSPVASQLCAQLLTLGPAHTISGPADPHPIGENREAGVFQGFPGLDPVRQRGPSSLQGSFGGSSSKQSIYSTGQPAPPIQSLLQLLERLLGGGHEIICRNWMGSFMPAFCASRASSDGGGAGLATRGAIFWMSYAIFWMRLTRGWVGEPHRPTLKPVS